MSWHSDNPQKVSGARSRQRLPISVKRSIRSSLISHAPCMEKKILISSLVVAVNSSLYLTYRHLKLLRKLLKMAAYCCLMMKYAGCYLFVYLFIHVFTCGAVVPGNTGQMLASVSKRKTGTQTPRQMRGGTSEAVEERDCWRTEMNQPANVRTRAAGTIYQFPNEQDLIHSRGREARSTPGPGREAAKAMS